MSQQLPPRPSLDHLKKQAKALLAQLRQANPGATLVAAQHTLARGYGFASWPQLKRYVELIAKVPVTVTFERYTSKAREALFFSRYEASQAGSLASQSEHVFLGLVRAGQGLKGRIFERLPLTLDAARAEIAAVRDGEPVPPTVAIPFSDRTKLIFIGAADEANRLGHEPIGLAHLLLGVLRDVQSPATIALGRKGIRLDSVRDGIAALLDERPL
jgi:ATP-dependent Clp protease ATP-binding subunit ClpC